MCQRVLDTNKDFLSVVFLLFSDYNINQEDNIVYNQEEIVKDEVI